MFSRKKISSSDQSKTSRIVGEWGRQAIRIWKTAKWTTLKVLLSKPREDSYALGSSMSTALVNSCISEFC